MIFTSFEFIIFFLLVLFIRGGFSNFNREKWFLLVVSYLFYMSWSIPCVLLIFGTSCFDYYVGKWLHSVNDPKKRKILLCASLVTNLGLLGFFKYTNFLLDNTMWLFSQFGYQPPPLHFEILLPVGISFFTFQSMSYTIDVYRRDIEPCKSWRDFLLFVSFFPQLVAGPIVRAADFLPQLQQRVRASAIDIEAGLALFILGAIKKAVLSDQIAGHVDMIFADPGKFDAVTLIQGAIGYSVQIYCDFSGYSDMAIGAARMMGFQFPLNFHMPYSAANITEFWRRWHISLSTWLRDYLYIPLGGNRLGPGRTYINLFLTMLLGGLWHGASWNFIIWGAIHGCALAAHKLWGRAKSSPETEQSAVIGFFKTSGSWFLTMLVVGIGWVFFRAQTFADACEFLSLIFQWNTSGTRMISPYILAAAFSVAVVHLLRSKQSLWHEEVIKAPVMVRVTAYAFLLVVLVALGATDASPFIYFQF